MREGARGRQGRRDRRRQMEGVGERGEGEAEEGINESRRGMRMPTANKQEGKDAKRKRRKGVTG